MDVHDIYSHLHIYLIIGRTSWCYTKILRVIVSQHESNILVYARSLILGVVFGICFFDLHATKAGMSTWFQPIGKGIAPS